MRVVLAVVALWLVGTVLLPLGALLIKSVEGRVYRNDVPLPDDFIPAEYRSFDTWGPEVLPRGYYFVMGDHRNNSSDSRSWKFVPKKYIIGRVQLRWWPVNHARLFDGFKGQ